METTGALSGDRRYLDVKFAPLQPQTNPKVKFVWRFIVHCMVFKNQ